MAGRSIDFNLFNQEAEMNTSIRKSIWKGLRALLLFGASAYVSYKTSGSVPIIESIPKEITGLTLGALATAGFNYLKHKFGWKF